MGFTAALHKHRVQALVLTHYIAVSRITASRHLQLQLVE